MRTQDRALFIAHLKRPGFPANTCRHGLRGIAQLVERRSPKPQVAGSSPAAPAIALSAGGPCAPAAGAQDVTRPGRGAAARPAGDPGIASLAAFPLAPSVPTLYIPLSGPVRARSRWIGLRATCRLSAFPGKPGRVALLGSVTLIWSIFADRLPAARLAREDHGCQIHQSI